MSLAALRSRVQELRGRASQGIPAVPWSDVLTTTVKLRAASVYVAASATVVGLDGWLTAVEDEWPADVVDALERLGLADRYDPQSLRWAVSWVSDASERGLISNWKGTVFEGQVADLVDRSDLSLPGGGDGLRLAEALNQPGWDAEVMSGDEVIGVVQMKATDSIGSIVEHLERYPEIPSVVTTHEAAEEAKARGLDVIDSGIRNAELEARVASATESIDFGSAVHEVVPGLGLAVLLAAAGARLQRGEDRDVVLKWLTTEGTVLAGSHGVGLIAEAAIGAPGLRPAATVATRLMVRRAQTQVEARARSEELGLRVAALRAAFS